MTQPHKTYLYWRVGDQPNCVDEEVPPNEARQAKAIRELREKGVDVNGVFGSIAILLNGELETETVGPEATAELLEATAEKLRDDADKLEGQSAGNVVKALQKASEGDTSMIEEIIRKVKQDD